MPTLEELGQKVKAKYPQYADVPDAELGAKVKAKYPEAYKDFEGGSTFDKMSVSQKAQGRLESMQSGPAKKQFDQAQESAQTDIDASTRKAGNAIKMMPFVAAAPLTGGVSLAAGSAIMGGAGLLGGGADQLVKHLTGSTEAETGKKLALTLGFEGAAGALTELGLRGVVMPVGKKLLSGLAIKAAAQVERGSNALNSMWFDSITKLWSKTKPYAADITQPLKEMAGNLGRLPSGLGEMGKTVGTISGRAGELLDAALADIGKQGTQTAGVTPIQTASGGVATRQPLDWVIAAKQSISQLAYKSKDLTRAEKEIFARLSKSLDGVIKTSLKQVGEEASDLYRYTNNIVKAQYQNDAAFTLVKKAVTRLAIGSVSGAAGAAYGYSQGDSGVAKTGGLAGTVAGLAAPSVAALVLEQVAKHPEGAATLGRAVNIVMGTGRAAIADALAKRAIKQAGADQTVKQSALLGP